MKREERSQQVVTETYLTEDGVPVKKLASPPFTRAPHPRCEVHDRLQDLVPDFPRVAFYPE